MFIDHAIDNGSLREERHARYAGRLHSYGAPVHGAAKSYRHAAPPEQRQWAKYFIVLIRVIRGDPWQLGLKRGDVAFVL
jgi:hypothetical protein